MKTQYFPNIIENPTDYYNELVNIEWEEGIRSKRGFTRLGKSLNVGDCDLVDILIATTMSKLNLNYQVNYIYLNYYKDGTYYTPSHSHPGEIQLVLSFGATRTLKVGSKEFKMNNGDAIIFGSAVHSVPKELTDQGRISIATFMSK